MVTQETNSSSKSSVRPELVFAIVAPAGVALQQLSDALKSHLESFGYRTVHVTLSSLLQNVVGWKEETDGSEYTRIRHRQTHAFELRKKTDGAALARAAIATIRHQRSILSGNPDTPADGSAYILSQLKHPDEVAVLRDVYGPSFFLVGAHAPRDMRVEHLAELMANRDDSSDHAKYKDKAELIVRIDDKEEVDPEEVEYADLGQNTRDTYPLADFFVDLRLPGLAIAPMARFVDLLFGHPFLTPTPGEYAMYQAAAASLRSSDETRQVGAVIAKLKENAGRTTNIDIVASGMNEVPRRGGGFYWQDESPDERDQAVKARDGIEPAERIKISALAEVIETMRKSKLLKDENTTPAQQIARSLLPNLKGTQFMNIGEFSRPVHAEMAALIDAARRGVAVDGLSMYVTTFPCHNCAKHIIAAGIRRVLYLEPYPKSRAKLLHGPEINLEPQEPLDERVAFFPFSGVAPRIYQKLFNMSARGGKRGIGLKEWHQRKKTISPKYLVRNAAEAYMLAERQELDKLPDTAYKWDKKIICP